MTVKLIREARRLLVSTGLPFEMNESSKHVEIFLSGQRCLTITRCSHGRDLKKLESRIRRITESL